MSVIVEGKKITMTRGDTLDVLLEIADEDGNPYVPVVGDKIRFALKKRYTDEDVLIETDIPIETPILHLDSSDTKSLSQPASYVYDIQLTYADGTVDTIIPKGTFKITEEVD